MNKIYQIYQVSDSTGETLDRIFTAVKAQFSKFECKTVHYSFTRTNNQIDKIISRCKNEKNIIILYTIVNNNLGEYLTKECKQNNIPCFEVLGNLITNFANHILNKLIIYSFNSYNYSLPYYSVVSDDFYPFNY